LTHSEPVDTADPKDLLTDPPPTGPALAPASAGPAREAVTRLRLVHRFLNLHFSSAVAAASRFAGGEGTDADVTGWWRCEGAVPPFAVDTLTRPARGACFRAGLPPGLVEDVLGQCDVAGEWLSNGFDPRDVQGANAGLGRVREALILLIRLWSYLEPGGAGPGDGGMETPNLIDGTQPVPPNVVARAGSAVADSIDGAGPTEPDPSGSAAGSDGKSPSADPQPATDGAAAGRAEIEDTPPRWDELGEAKQSILIVLSRASKRLKGQAVAQKAGYKPGTLRHHYGDLKRWNYIDRSNDGYGITQTGAALVSSHAV
jgi:hypothetical protein